MHTRAAPDETYADIHLSARTVFMHSTCLKFIGVSAAFSAPKTTSCITIEKNDAPILFLLIKYGI